MHTPLEKTCPSRVSFASAANEIESTQAMNIDARNAAIALTPIEDIIEWLENNPQPSMQSLKNSIESNGSLLIDEEKLLRIVKRYPKETINPEEDTLQLPSILNHGEASIEEARLIQVLAPGERKPAYAQTFTFTSNANDTRTRFYERDPMHDAQLRLSLGDKFLDNYRTENVLIINKQAEQNPSHDVFPSGDTHRAEAFSQTQAILVLQQWIAENADLGSYVEENFRHIKIEVIESEDNSKSEMFARTVSLKIGDPYKGSIMGESIATMHILEQSQLDTDIDKLMKISTARLQKIKNIVEAFKNQMNTEEVNSRLRGNEGSAAIKYLMSLREELAKSIPDDALKNITSEPSLELVETHKNMCQRRRKTTSSREWANILRQTASTLFRPDSSSQIGKHFEPIGFSS